MNFCLDKKLEVSTDQAITATAYSDSIEFGGAGEADGCAFDIRVKTAFATSNAGTLAIGIQDSPDGTTFTTRVTTPAFAAAALSASVGGNPLVSIGVPKGHAKYLRLVYTVVNAFTAGKVTANLNTVK